MKKIMAAALILISALAFADEGYKTVQIGDVAKWVGSKEILVHLYDANTEKTRLAEGVIPGATKLSSSTTYDLAVLPQDKSEKLVFYCANVACSASHAAAKRAVQAGYKNVNVMADGIIGWRKAGYFTDKYTAKSEKPANNS